MMYSDMRKYCISIILVFSVISAFGQGGNNGDWTEKLDSSVVNANRVRTLGSHYHATPGITARVLSVTGENDILKIASGKAGVLQAVGGTNGYFVRGAGNGNNHIELAGIPVYRNNHLMGLVSIFPSQMIEEMSFAKGGFSGAAGNYTSSITSISLKSSQAERIKGSVSASPYMEGAYLEVPIFKSLTLRASARGSATPSVLGALNSYSNIAVGFDLEDVSGYAYDLMSTLSWNPSDVFSANMFFLKAGDKFFYDFSDKGHQYRSWESLFGINMKLQTGIGVFDFNGFSTIDFASSAESNKFYLINSSRYVNYLGMESRNTEKGVRLKFDSRSYGIFSYGLGLEHNTRKMDYISGIRAGISDNKLSSFFGSVSFTEPNLYDIKASIRHNNYKNKDYSNSYDDIHLKADVFAYKQFGFELTYDRNSQFFHVLEGVPTGWNQDLMYAADETFPLETSKQGYVGLFGELTVNKNLFLEFSGGFYTKQMDGLVSFVKASHVFGVVDVKDEQELDVGKGKSKGFELSVSARTGRFSLETAYTYSRTHRQYPAINEGREFFFRFDRPHVLNANASYVTHKAKTSRFNHSQRASLALSYEAGTLMTYPIGQYVALLPNIQGKLQVIDVYGDVNNFRLPYCFRIDAGYTFSWEKDGKGYDLTFSVFNLTNRHNPYQYFIHDGRWKQLSIMGIMPSLNFIARF